MGDITWDIEDTVLNIQNDWQIEKDFVLVLGKNWTDWQEDDALRGRKLRRLG